MSIKKRGLCLILVPLLILFIFIFAFSKYLDYKFENDYSVQMATYYGEPVKNKGVAFQERGMKEDDLMIFGSSELGAAVPQNPKNMFPNNFMKSNGNVIGQGLTQDLIHSINIGGIDKSIKDKKVVYILSLQWFMAEEKNGDIDVAGFAGNFSSLQYYRYINNDNISENEKLEVSKRVEQLIKSYPTLKQDYIYAKLHSSNSFPKKVVRVFMEPYYFLRDKYLAMKDKYDSIDVVQFVKGKTLEINKIDWKEENIKAEELAKSLTTNNDWYINDEYYNTFIKGKLDEIKGSYKNINLNTSKEWDDLKIFLDTCKQTGVEPYIVLMPTNGTYYDYTGLTKEKRHEFYDKAEKITSSYGFETLNLKDKEYEPYFMYDAMHLGWKGWLYINEKIVGHFNGTEK